MRWRTIANIASSNKNSRKAPRTFQNLKKLKNSLLALFTILLTFLKAKQRRKRHFKRLKPTLAVTHCHLPPLFVSRAPPQYPPSPWSRSASIPACLSLSDASPTVLWSRRRTSCTPRNVLPKLHTQYQSLDRLTSPSATQQLQFQHRK